MRIFRQTLLAGLLVVLLVAGIWVWAHNSLVKSGESVEAGWAQVESNYQRRADLVPGLVESVSRYLRHERETLSNIVRERNGGLRTLAQAVDEADLARRESGRVLASQRGAAPRSEGDLASVAATQEQLQGRILRLFALAESYPALRAGDQMLTLQAQLEGAENRINVARMRFNEAVRNYNRMLRTFPLNLVARWEGLQPRAYFQAEEGAERSPGLGFDG